MTDTVYLLWHSHEISASETDEKLIGVYRTREAAEQAISRTKLLPGFVDCPQGFEIDAYEIGVDNWTEGYATV